MTNITDKVFCPNAQLAMHIDIGTGRFDRDCIVIDFETTGKDPNTAEVLQVSIIDGWGLTLLNTYCKPERATAWPEAQAIHGITPDMVKDRPTFRQLVPAVRGIINRAPFLIAYNARYEMCLLVRHGVSIGKPFVDPMLMFAPCFGEWNAYRGDYKWQKLETAARFYKYTFQAHDALADVKATLHVFECMVKEGVPPVNVAC